MRTKAVGVIVLLAVGVLVWFGRAQAQTYATQPITAQNAAALMPLLAFDHAVPLDSPYPDGPEPTPPYNNPVRDPSAPELIFSPDNRFLAHIVEEPLMLWLVDLHEGTERVFPLDGVDVSISPDWRTLAVVERAGDTFNRGLVSRLWDMEALLALPRAPVGQAVSRDCRFNVSISSTNLRARPAVGYDSLGYALADEVYPAVAMSLAGDWIQLHGATQPAWIGAQYGTLDGDCAALPVRLTAGGERAVIDNRVAAFSPDGRFIVAGFWGNYTSSITVEVYSADSGDRLYELTLTPFFSFSPDSRLLTDSAGRFFDLATGEMRYSVTGEDNRQTRYGSVFSPTGTRVAVNGTDGIVRLLDAESGAELRTFTPPSGRVFVLEFSPDERYLLIMSYEDLSGVIVQRAFLWDLTSEVTTVFATGESDASIALPELTGSSFGQMTFLPDGGGILLTTSQPGSISVWDIAARDFRFRTATYGNNRFSVSVSPGGEALVAVDIAGSENSRLTFRDFQTGETMTPLTLPYFRNFSPDGRWAVAEDYERRVTLWGVPANATVPTLPPTVTQTLTPSITPTPPGFVPTAGPTGSAGDPFVQLWQETAAALALTPSPTFTASPSPVPTTASLAITPPPGVEAITAANYERVKLLNTFPSPDNRRAFYQFAGMTADGSRMVMAGGATISVWDVYSGQVVRTIDNGGDFITGIDVSQDGRHVLTRASDGVLRLWELDSGTLVNSIMLEGRVYSDLPIHLSPDNRRALVQESTSGGGVYLRVRDLQSGEIVLDDLEDYDTRAGFRPDGTVIWWQPWVISSEDSSEIGHQLYRLPDDRGTIVPSSDMTRIATFDSQRVNIHLWDTAGGRDPLVLQGHTAPVREVSFSPDARLLVSFDANDEMRVWDTETGENLTTIPDGLLPNGMHAGQGRWLFRAADGSPLLWNFSGMFAGLITGIGDNLSISADGATIIAANRSVVLLFGIPSAQRPAYASIPAAVVPSGINVRPQPSLDAAPSGTVEHGFVIVAGRDASGQFVYLPEADGWALADPAYINLGDIPVMELPVRGETG